MTRQRLAIAVQKASKLRPLPSAADIRGWVGAAAGCEARGEITVRIVDEPESAELNQHYRGKAGATNVLAFPAGPLPELPADATLGFPAAGQREAGLDAASPVTSDLWRQSGISLTPDGSPSPLGDLVVCAPVIEREAQQQAKTSSAHWAHIVMHGTLHLLGYDHETDPAARVMEDRERELLAGFGFGDPYSVESQ